MSIRDRQGNYAFVKDRSYLAQLNEWAARPIIKFEVTRDGGEDHMPLFRATPILSDGRRLDDCAVTGHSKKEATVAAEMKAREKGILTRVELKWNVTNIGGQAHMPTFRAIPVVNNEELTEHEGIGTSKKQAMEAAAAELAGSGHI